MTEYLIVFIVAFICFGFIRRFFYFQAYQSFTKAADDFRKREVKSRKPDGSVTIERKTSSSKDGEYVEWEEVK
jgi:hypothetical protein